LSWLFTVEIVRGKPAQFLINDGQQLLGGLGITAVDGIQKLRDFHGGSKPGGRDIKPKHIGI
jgi:hypothetical protein